MTLAASGIISIGGTTANRSINLELDRAQNFPDSNLNETAMRTLADKASGTIAIGDFYSKTNRKVYNLSYTGNTADVNVNLSNLSGYLTGKADVYITIGSGVYIYSNAIGTAALTISGASTGDTVTITNNGYIIGKGGKGAGWSSINTVDSYIASQGGGPGILCGCTTTIINNGYICGGGGGGGAAAALNASPIGGASGPVGGGGGAGGGIGGDTLSMYIQSSIQYTLTGTGGGGGGLGDPGAGGGGGGGGVFYVALGGGGGGRVVSDTATGGAAPSITANSIANYSNARAAGGQAGGSGAVAGFVSRAAGGGGGGGWGATGGSGKRNGGTGAGLITFSASGGAGGAGTNPGGDAVLGATLPGTRDVYGGSAGGPSINKNGKTVTISSGATRIYGGQV